MKQNDIFHYTSIDAFVQMLKMKTKTKASNLTFWASNVHYMNDPHEMDFLYGEINRVLPELEKEMGINEKDMPFSAFNFSNINSNGIKVELDNDFREIIYNIIYKNVYAISFSRKKDYLPMWSMYGNNGGGLCLQFNYDKLKSYIENVGKKDLTKKKGFEVVYVYCDSDCGVAGRGVFFFMLW